MTKNFTAKSAGVPPAFFKRQRLRAPVVRGTAVIHSYYASLDNYYYAARESFAPLKRGNCGMKKFVAVLCMFAATIVLASCGVNPQTPLSSEQSSSSDISNASKSEDAAPVDKGSTTTTTTTTTDEDTTINSNDNSITEQEQPDEEELESGATHAAQYVFTGSPCKSSVKGFKLLGKGGFFPGMPYAVPAF